MKIALVFMVVTANALVLGPQFLTREAIPTDRRGPSSPTSPPSAVAANGVVEGGRPEAGLRPEVAGRLVALHVRENAEVQRGDLLLELDNGTQQARLALAAAELARARADLDKLRNGARKEERAAAAAAERAREQQYEHARADFQRCQELRAQRSISQERWDEGHYKMLTAEASWKQATAERELIEAPPRPEDVAVAQARVAAAEANLRLAEAEFARTRLLAPSAGRVLRVHAEPGEMVGPTSARPVLVMADLTIRRVRAFVEELDCTRVRVGQKAVITADGVPGKEFAGRVAEVLPGMGKRAPQSDAPGEYRDVYFREILIDLEAGDVLPPSLRVQVRIPADSAARIEARIGGR